MASKELYVSYHREKESFSFIKSLIEEASKYPLYHAKEEQNEIIEEQLSEHFEQGDQDKLDKIIIQYDENIETGGSISEFMAKLIHGEQIVFLISELYFQSVFCMYELCEAYQERAGDLLPIVVVDSQYDTIFQDRNECIKDIIEYWTDMAKSPKKENAALQSRCKDIEKILPLALAWIIPPADQQTNQTPQQKMIVASDEHACKKVFQLCQEEHKPLYRLISPRERDLSFIKISQKITEALENKQLYEGFAKIFDPNGSTIETAMRKEVDGNSPTNALSKLNAWLQSIEEDAKIQEKDKKVACEQAIKLQGWLLLYSIDLEKLSFLVLELNHSPQNACIFI